MRFLVGEHVMLNYVDMKPYVEVMTHSHPHEQLGLMLQGELNLWIGDEEHVLRTGDLRSMMECLAENGEDPEALVVQVALRPHACPSSRGGCEPADPRPWWAPLTNL